PSADRRRGQGPGRHLRLHRPGVRLHLHAAAPPGPARAVRRRLERRAGDGRPAGGARGQCSVPDGPAAVAREPYPPLRAGTGRPPAYATQGVRPRVWFGERWITSMFDLFEENVRLFPALIPESRDMAEKPLLTESASPRLHELMLHNSTV